MDLSISTLPQESSWKISENFCKYQGFWCYSNILNQVILSLQNFTPQPTDIFLCTTPKSGTTWLKALSFAILTRTQFPITNSISSPNPLLSKNPHEIVPYLEFSSSHGFVRDTQNPLFSTHIPFTYLPKSVLDSKSTKIIYLCRNPKDVLVSLWHFTPRLGDGTKVIPFEEAFEKFSHGISSFGPYWDHVLGYWKASLEFPERVLFLKYEDMKNDTGFYVKKIADFMGCSFSVDEEKRGVVEKIVELCSFEILSNLEVNKSKQGSRNLPLKIENSAFFRKGEIGDWKNYLTVEMAARIDQITEQKFKDTLLKYSFRIF